MSTAAIIDDNDAREVGQNSFELESGRRRRRKKTVWDECVAEAFGSAMIIVFGSGVVATWKLNDFPDSGDAFAKCLYTNTAWAFGVTLGVLVSFNTSGAFLNPALLLNAVITDGFPVGKALCFTAAQTVGFCVGAFLVTINFALMRQEVHIWNFYTTGPGEGTSFLNAAFNEFLGTAMLSICVAAITNQQPAINKFHVAGFVGLSIFAIGNVFGPMSGYALNPARDFGPRICYLFCAMVFDECNIWIDVFQSGYFIVPIVAPCVGAVAGGLAYKHFIFLEDVESREAQ